MKGGPTGNLSTQTYVYDRYGNRTSVTATGVAADNSTMPTDGIPNLAYNTTNNRITTAGFQYDAAGNQTRALAEDGVTWVKYEYDAANRIQFVKRDDGTALQAFQYGSTNARLMDTDYGLGLTRMFASVGGTVLAEYTEFSYLVLTWTKGFTYMGDSLLSTLTPNGAGGETVEFDHPDRLGTRLKTNQASGASSEQAHLPFGRPLNAESTLTNNARRFTSYERSSATGLDYAINRTYDSKQGRFTQVDPIGMQSVTLVNPQTLNLYAYCANDPVNNVDPSGLGFFSFLKKLLNVFAKIVKILLIAVAVAIAIAVIFFAPMMMPLAMKVKLLIAAGSMIAGALAPPKIGFIIGIVTGLVLVGPGIITNFAETVSKLTKWQKLLMASNFLGPIANSFARRDAKEERRRKGLIKSAYYSALWRLAKMPGCKGYIQGASRLDPANRLEVLYKANQIYYDPSLGLGQNDDVAYTDASGIRLGQKYFYDKTVGGWVGTMNLARTRTLTLLHELKHAMLASHPSSGSAKDFNDEIMKKCFGVNP